MSQAINYTEAIAQVDALIEEGWSNQDIFDYFIDKGYSKKQVFNVFVQSGLATPSEKVKNDVTQNIASEGADTSENNPMEDALGGILSLAIKYGLPLLLMIFGAAYVGSELNREFSVGVRSAAAAIMPLAVTLAFAKSDIRHNAADFLSDNKLIAFAFSFALAMGAAAGAMYMRQYDNIIPIGELAFSTTLALMIFGKNRDGEASMIHVGAVTGFLTYVVLFGVAV